MPTVFISYRRDDTAAEAGRLADDLGERFGTSRVFIDVDSIPLATNFEDRIHAALDSCQVVFVLIGSEWLTARLPGGERRIDDEHDYLRQEIAAALNRKDVAVIPVLIEGAKMPSPADLPSDISALAKINAVDLSHRRWRGDVGTLSAVAQRYDQWWSRAFTWFRARVVRTTLIVVLAGAVVAAGIIASTRSGPPAQNRQTRATLIPASVPSKVDLCSRQLTFAVDGTVAPLMCSGGRLNSQAWQYFANGNLLVLSVGPDATPGRVRQALCSDLRGNKSTTIPKEMQAYQLAARYYAWDFVLPVDQNLDTCVS